MIDCTHAGLQCHTRSLIRTLKSQAWRDRLMVIRLPCPPSRVQRKEARRAEETPRTLHILLAEDSQAEYGASGVSPRSRHADHSPRRGLQRRCPGLPPPHRALCPGASPPGHIPGPRSVEDGRGPPSGRDSKRRIAGARYRWWALAERIISTPIWLPLALWQPISPLPGAGAVLEAARVLPWRR